MEHNPIQALLEEIERDAAAETAALLLQQDDFLRAIELVEEFKTTSPTLADLKVTPCYYSTSEGWGFNVYADRTDTIALCAALIDHVGQLTTRLHGDKWESWTLADYPGLQILMPRGVSHALARAA